MLTLTDLLAVGADLFSRLGLEPLIATALVVGLAVLLTRRVMAAVRTDPDDPYAGYSAAEQQHAEREDFLDRIEETDPDEFHRRVEEDDAALAALVDESEAWWREGRQELFGDGASD